MRNQIISDNILFYAQQYSNFYLFYSNVKCCYVLCCIVLCCIVLYCIVLYCIVLYCKI